MNYDETNISFLQDDLVKAFGREKADFLYRLMCEKYTGLCKKETRFLDDAMNEHIFKRLLPTIGIYLSLMENGFSKEDALVFVLREIQRGASDKAVENAKFSRMPFSYFMFRLFAKPHMKKSYPIEGFSVKWREINNKEVHFDITRCIYKDMCDKYACPELCKVFCRSDITSFAGYRPKIMFKRLGTIGEGSDCCDFHFIRGN